MTIFYPNVTVLEVSWALSDYNSAFKDLAILDFNMAILDTINAILVMNWAIWDLNLAI